MVLLPIYKSYTDPLILHYINYKYDIELGFTVGHYEDQPRIKFVEELLKRTGCLLMRRKEQQDMTISYVN